jgi:DNA-binding transcriptional LysR family regulator
MRYLSLFTLAVLASCNNLPRDPDGTLDRIRQQRQLTVGLVDGATSPQVVVRLLDKISHDTQAAIAIRSRAAEPLLAEVRDGKLDLIIGPFEKDSPWATDVAFGPPLAHGAGDIEIKAAMRNGENRWIMLVERAARSVSQEAREE